MIDELLIRLGAQLRRSDLSKDKVKSGLSEDKVNLISLMLADEITQFKLLEACFAGEIRIDLTTAYTHLSGTNQRRVDEMFARGKLEGQFKPHVYFWPQTIRDSYFPQLQEGQCYRDPIDQDEGGIEGRAYRLGDVGTGICIASFFGQFPAPRSGRISIEHCATTQRNHPGPMVTVFEIESPSSTPHRFSIHLRQDSSTVLCASNSLSREDSLTKYMPGQGYNAHDVLKDMQRVVNNL